MLLVWDAILLGIFVVCSLRLIHHAENTTLRCV